MIKIKSNLIKMLKNIFSDIILVYRNFFFWFKVKFFGYILGIILGIIFIIPSIFLELIYAGFKNINISEIIDITSDLNDISDYGIIIFTILNYILFSIGFLYNYIFLSKFYLKFFEERKKFKLEIFKTFFNFKNIKKFFFLSIILFSLLSFLGLLITIFYLNLAEFEGIRKSLNYFVISGKIDKNIIFSGFFSIFVFFGVIYLFYKFSFSYFFMFDKKSCPIRSIKESFGNTDFKKFIKVLICLIIFLFPFLGVKSIFENTIRNLEKEKNDIYNYIAIKRKEELKEKYKKDFEILELKYFGANKTDLENRLKSIFLSIYFIKILDFLIIFGSFTLIYVSIYNNIIKKKND